MYYVICVGERNIDPRHAPQTEKKGDVIGPFGSFFAAESYYRDKYQSMVYQNFIVVRRVLNREAEILDGTAGDELKEQYIRWIQTGKQQWL